MKIAHFLGEINDGGASHLVLNYTGELMKDSENKVYIIVFGSTIVNDNSTISNKFRNEGAEIIYLEDRKEDNLLIRFIKRCCSLSRIIYENNFDVLHTHLNVLIYYIMTFKYKNDMKLVHTFHSEINRLVKESKFYYKWSVEFSIKYLSMVPIALTKAMKNDADSIFHTDKTVVIYNCIDVDRFSNKHDTKEEDNRLIIGNVGRLDPVKNHTFMIDIAERLKDKYDGEFEFWFIGSGSIEKEIKERVYKEKLEDIIKFLGNRDDIPSILFKMNVFVFPSKVEGFGLAAIEAQTAGVPCIVSKGVPEEIKVSDGCLFLEIDNADVWADAILKYKNYSTQIDHVALREFDIKNNIKKLLEVYC